MKSRRQILSLSYLEVNCLSTDCQSYRTIISYLNYFRQRMTQENAGVHTGTTNLGALLRAKMDNKTNE